jgi:hypothetical protein
MSDLHIQASFNTGEWAPSLNARVDLQKYRSAAALLQNWIVDYRGGASTRPGTKYILQAYKSAIAVRLIPFQASLGVGYMLEFGDGYIRFYNNGAPVLETATSITAAAAGPPEVFTDAAHGYNDNDWIFVGGSYYIVQNATTNTFTLTDLFGNDVNANPFAIPASASRVYTLPSPYAAADLALIKYAQNVNVLILCHPSYAPQVLTLITATNWTLNAIVFGTTIATPTNTSVATTLSTGSVNYAYVVTAIDAKGQESTPSTPATLSDKQDIRSVAGTNVVSWNSVPGASSYNVYEADVSYFGAVPVGATYGFIGNTTGTSFVDSNIGPDFSTTPPIVQNPFVGAGVQNYNVQTTGIYTTPPTVIVAAPPSGVQATAQASLGATAMTINHDVANRDVGSGTVPTVSPVGYNFVLTGGEIIQVTAATFIVFEGESYYWEINSFTMINAGSVTSGTAPNPDTITSSTWPGFNSTLCSFNVTWGVTQLIPIQAGDEYLLPPAVTFSTGLAAATAVLAPASAGNPSVPGFFQQRLVLAGPNGQPQQFNMSQTGFYYNFNVNNPVQANNAIQGSLVSGQQNTIKSMAPVASGLLMLSDRASWLINGGSAGSAVAPEAIVANAQSYIGASDVPPIIVNYDVLFVQAKGSIVRDNTFNIYVSVITGQDISILSSHLFYGYTIDQWAWAEEPFKVVWAIRSDGTMLTLTFMKEQDFIGWTHSVTQGSFLSVATVTENTSTAGEVDAIYTVVERTVNGVSVQYIERVAERTFPNGVQDAWCVDAGIQYTGAATLNFTGATQLGGLSVTGLQTDDQGNTTVITPFVMPLSGAFALPAPPAPATGYVKVTVGLGYTCDLQTLAIELGEPTAQGKVKNIPSVDVRVSDTLGLSIGPDFNHLVPMKDLVVGNVSSMLTGQQSQIVTDLVTGDARTFLAPAYTVPGQYCIRQSNPMPASVLGVIPNVVVGDDR